MIGMTGLRMSQVSMYMISLALPLVLFVSWAEAWAPMASGILPGRQARGLQLKCSLRMQAQTPECDAEGVSRRSVAALIGLATLGLWGGPANADMTLTSIKRSYFRWVPRIEGGRDLYVLTLRGMIAKKDWDGVKQLFEKVSMAQDDSEKQALGLDIKVSSIDNNILNPMTLWTTSFAEKGTSPKQRKLDSKVAALRTALDAIKAAALQADQKAAEEAWEAGRVAFNGYIKTANKGLTLQVKKLETIPEDWTSYTETVARPGNAFRDTGRAITDD